MSRVCYWKILSFQATFHEEFGVDTIKPAAFLILVSLITWFISSLGKSHEYFDVNGVCRLIFLFVCRVVSVGRRTRYFDHSVDYFIWVYCYISFGILGTYPEHLQSCPSFSDGACKIHASHNEILLSHSSRVKISQHVVSHFWDLYAFKFLLKALWLSSFQPGIYFIR